MWSGDQTLCDRVLFQGLHSSKDPFYLVYGGRVLLSITKTGKTVGENLEHLAFSFNPAAYVLSHSNRDGTKQKQ